MPRRAKRNKYNHAADYTVNYEGEGGSAEAVTWDGLPFAICSYNGTWNGCGPSCVNNMSQSITATNISDIGRVNGVLNHDEPILSEGSELLTNVDFGLVDVQNVVHCMIEIHHWFGRAGEVIASQEYTLGDQTIEEGESPVQAFTWNEEGRQKFSDALAQANPPTQAIICVEFVTPTDRILHFIACWRAVEKDGWLMIGGEPGAKALYVSANDFVPLLFTEQGRELLAHRLSCAFGMMNSIHIKEYEFLLTGRIQNRQPVQWNENITTKNFKLRADGRTVVTSRGEYFGGVHALRLVKAGDTDIMEKLSLE
jgi:hypothetical protein